MNIESHQLINQDSGDTEYFTPLAIVNAARWVMGSIDLDPASSAAANQRVKAGFFFDEATNGLTQQWHGNVWLNHPFSRKGNRLWIEKLLEEFDEGRVEQACVITFAATSEKWFQPLADFPQCYLSPRTNFYLPDGKLKRGVSKGSVVSYLSPLAGALEAAMRFADGFRTFGSVKVPLWATANWL